MMNNKTFALLLGVMMMALTAQFNKVNAQDKHYKLTFSNVNIRQSCLEEPQTINGQGTIDICDKKGGQGTITVTYGGKKETYKIMKSAEAKDTDNGICMTFLGDEKQRSLFNLCLSEYEGELQLYFAYLEGTADAYELCPLIEFDQTDTSPTQNVNTIKQLFNDMKSGKTSSFINDEDFYV